MNSASCSYYPIKYSTLQPLPSIFCAGRFIPRDVRYILTQEAHARRPRGCEGFPRGCVPVPLKIGMTFFPEALPCMVAEPAFKRLKTRAVQLAQSVLQKTAAKGRKLLQRKAALTAPERRGQHAEGQIRRHFKHHTVAEPRLDRPCGLADRPPAGSSTIAAADWAAAGRRRRIFLIESGYCFLMLFHHRLSLLRGCAYPVLICA